MQSILYEKVSTIYKYLKKNKVEIADWVDYTVKREQVEHNYNLIKNNPEIALKEFQKKAIIITED